jgi:hypothetical protein
MNVVSVATADSRAYYSILSRLKRTNLRFVSVTLSQAAKKDQGALIIITTRKELGFFDQNVIPIPMEELDDDPLIMEGQILSRIFNENKRSLLIGVDPGSRIGLVIFYGGVELGSLTMNSVESLERSIFIVVNAIPHAKATIKIGDGAPRLSKAIAQNIARQLPDATVEVVDEKGTSVIDLKPKGRTRDQSAASKIAFRRGVIFKEGRP